MSHDVLSTAFGSHCIFAEGGDCSLVRDNGSFRHPSFIPGGLPTEALPYAEVIEEQWAYFLLTVAEAQNLLETRGDSMPVATKGRLSDLVARHQTLNAEEQTDLGKILTALR